MCLKDIVSPGVVFPLGFPTSLCKCKGYFEIYVLLLLGAKHERTCLISDQPALG
jgi:hypothetical protein